MKRQIIFLTVLAGIFAMPRYTCALVLTPISQVRATEATASAVINHPIYGSDWDWQSVTHNAPDFTPWTDTALASAYASVSGAGDINAVGSAYQHSEINIIESHLSADLNARAEYKKYNFMDASSSAGTTFELVFSLDQNASMLLTGSLYKNSFLATCYLKLSGPAGQILYEKSGKINETSAIDGEILLSAFQQYTLTADITVAPAYMEGHSLISEMAYLDFDATINETPIPEPSSIILFCLAGLIAAKRK